MRPMLEELECRQLLSCAYRHLSGGALEVKGTAVANQVEITRQDDGVLQVRCDGGSGAFGNVSRVVVKTLGGNDSVNHILRQPLTSALVLDVQLGKGNDRFEASAVGAATSWGALTVRVSASSGKDVCRVPASAKVTGCEDTRTASLVAPQTPRANQPPLLTPITDRSVAPGETVTFTATATDPDGIAASPPTWATSTAYSVPAGTHGNESWSGPLGMDFDIVTPVRVTQLGVFDDGSDGLTVPITARLYNRDNPSTPMTTLTFAAGSTGTLVAGSRFQPLQTPLELPAGFHGTIVAEGYGATERNGNATYAGAGSWTTNSSDGSITFVGTSRYGPSTRPGSYPTFVDSEPANGYAAGTFVFERATSGAAGSGLNFSLDNAPAGAGINPQSGVFTWKPDNSTASGNYSVTVRVTDTGTPARSDSKSFTITVTAPPTPKPTVVLSGAILTVTGTEGHDEIVLRQVNGQISVDGVSASFPTALVAGISISALGGNDVIFILPGGINGSQDVTLPVTILGGDGHDVIFGGVGDDSLDGGTGNDLIMDLLGRNAILGGSGIDALVGGFGYDEIHGGAGTDFLFNLGGFSRLWGDEDMDFLFGSSDGEAFFGGEGTDVILAGDGNDVLSGNAGSDLLLGEMGNDSIFGSDGSDIINAGDGNDSVVGGGGDDLILGGDGDDSLNGDTQYTAEDGNDYILGGAGDDTMRGGDGNDYMDGGFGYDQPHGGKGINIYLDPDQFDTLDAINALFIGHLNQTAQQTQFSVVPPAASSVPSRTWDLAADPQVQDVMNAVQVATTGGVGVGNPLKNILGIPQGVTINQAMTDEQWWRNLYANNPAAGSVNMDKMGGAMTSMKQQSAAIDGIFGYEMLRLSPINHVPNIE